MIKLFLCQSNFRYLKMIGINAEVKLVKEASYYLPKRAIVVDTKGLLIFIMEISDSDTSHVILLRDFEKYFEVCEKRRRLCYNEAATMPKQHNLSARVSFLKFLENTALYRFFRK